MSDGTPVPFRGGGFSPKTRLWIGALVFAVLIGLIELGTWSGWIGKLTLPRPSDVGWTLYELWDSGLLWAHVVPSLTRFAMGALVGASTGIAVGVLIGLFSHIRSGLVPLVAAIFPIPFTL